jgi:hypothetical protein
MINNRGLETSMNRLNWILLYYARPLILVYVTIYARIKARLWIRKIRKNKIAR